MKKTVEEQIKIIGKGVADIISIDELILISVKYNLKSIYKNSQICYN